MRIYDIDTPEKIKNLSVNELMNLADQMRSLMIQTVSKKGGHLAKNLSVVELTLAIHSIFDMPKDKLIFDGGDCCYAHKMITGRSTRFSNLRSINGLSDTQQRSESIYDIYEATDFSACSAALGFAIARDSLHEDYDVLAYIDQDALNNGKTLEALYDIGKQNRDIIIIYNENESGKHSSLFDVDSALTTIRTSDLYQNVKSNIRNMSSTSLKNTFSKMKNTIKDGMSESSFFKSFHIDVIGPVDGHDIKVLMKSLKACKNHTGPVVLHIVTKNGYGYEYALNNKEYDICDPFNIDTGEKLFKVSKKEASFPQIMDDTLSSLKTMETRLVKIDTDLYAKSKFKEKYPESYISMANGYQHAMSTACGIALGNAFPYVSIPSTEISDSFHSICMEMAKMKCGMVVGIENCGLINQNKEHGIYDISTLMCIPNLILCQPKDSIEAQNLLYSAILHKKPTCIRLPYGITSYHPLQEYTEINTGSWEMFKVGSSPKAIVISYGLDVDRILQKAKENEYSIYVVNARYLKPLDYQMIDEIIQYNLPILVFEQACEIGGLKSCINDYIHNTIKELGIEDHFVNEGSLKSVRIDENICLEALFKEIENENSSR